MRLLLLLSAILSALSGVGGGRALAMPVAASASACRGEAVRCVVPAAIGVRPAVAMAGASQTVGLRFDALHVVRRPLFAERRRE